MKIFLFCAAERGRRFLEKICDLAEKDDITVFSFKEEPWEPPFLSAIKNLAASRGCGFQEIPKTGSGDLIRRWYEKSPDLAFFVGWRYLLPLDLISRKNTVNVVFHDSMLPEYRGFSPTQWAVINGETDTGVTMFIPDSGMDEGDIIDQIKVPIGPLDYIKSVTESVTQAYLDLLEKNFTNLKSGNFKTHPRITPKPRTRRNAYLKTMKSAGKMQRSPYSISYGERPSLTRGLIHI